MRVNSKALFAIILLATLVSILLAFPVQLPGEIGATDFRPYWSSSYLLAHHNDFGNPEQLERIERTLTGWDEPYVMHAWFAPIGNLVLIPYTYLPFPQAVFYWLLTSTAVIFAVAILLWPYNKTHLWIPVIVTFGYSMTIASLASGQVNTLEALGLALFLTFSRTRHDFRAGMSLVLTTIKPHLVIITLPLLLIDLTRRGQWRALAGFFITLLGCGLILTILYPAWLRSFWNLMTFGMGLTRETPTLNGLLVIAGEYKLGKWLWALALAIAICIWAKYGKGWSQRTLIDTTILVGLIVSPVGWSYDQVMLLFPLLRILEWIKDGALGKMETRFVVGILLIANALSYYQRTLGISDIWFVWVPLFTSCIYFSVWQRAKTILEFNADTSSP